MYTIAESLGVDPDRMTLEQARVLKDSCDIIDLKIAIFPSEEEDWIYYARPVDEKWYEVDKDWKKLH